MSEEESKVPTEEQKPSVTPFPDWVIPEEDVPEVYADWYYVNWLPLTVRMRFGQIVADPRLSPGHKDSSWVIKEGMALTLPWHTVKALAAMLTNLVQEYEKENGELTIPKIPKIE